MYKGKKIFAFIPARGGSKRVKNKNIRKLCGKPLIYYTIKACQQSKYLDRFILSTDDEKIRKAAKRCGMSNAAIWGRKPEQNADTYSTDMMRNDFYKSFHMKAYDYIITLHPTSPFRTSEDIDTGIEKIIDNDGDSLLSLTRIWHLPWQAIHIKNGLCKYTFGDKYRFAQSQELPAAYTNAHFLTIWKWGKNKGKEIPYIIDEIKGHDIDTELDFEIAKSIMKNLKA